MNQLEYLICANVAIVLWIFVVIIYRLYLHPLAKIPGPRFAAISAFYEWYSDCVQPGVYAWKIQKWHDQYGPILRIGPNEVHISDADWFNTFYSPNTKYDKDPWFYGFIGDHDAAFSTTEHEAHRTKRSNHNRFFSRQNVDKSTPIITGVLKTMLDRFEAYRSTGRPLAVKNALKCFAADVVCEYCFPEGSGFSHSPDFAGAYHDGQENFTRLFPWFRHFPGLAYIMASLPGWLMMHMGKQSQAAMSFIKFVQSQVDKSIQQSKAQELKPRRSIIRDIYESNIPEKYRTRYVLEREAVTFVVAGTSTVSRTVEAGLFYILQDPAILRRLVDEIRAFKPEEKGILTHRELEGLPYLSAVVLECQRRHPTIPSRLPRTHRTQDIMYKDYLLPRGTVIGMAPWDVLLNDQIWGNAFEFQPSRWLDPAYKTKMQKYMVPFGRGSRNCVGQTLAIAEMYMLLGNIFRRFDLALFDTDESEIKPVHVCFEALAYKGSVGVQLLLN